jgi:hypothetical protein
MAENKPGDQPKTADQTKTIEMRLAALEDKLSKMHVTEEEMKAFQKVSSLMAADPSLGAAAQGAVPQVTPQLSPIVCQIARSRFVCWPPTIVPRVFCFECICGPCNPGGGGFGGGGFGGFGM